MRCSSSSTRRATPSPPDPRGATDPLLIAPAALARLAALRAGALLFDFDGTLAAIADDPAAVELAPAVRDDLATLAGRLPLGVVSGRALTDLRARVGLPGVWYAGSHGFELCTPDGTLQAPYPAFLPRLARIEGRLRRRFADLAGVRVERKPYAVAVHYRAVPERRQEVQVRVAEAVERARRLRTLPGKAVIDVLPDVAWGKGQAARWMLAACGNPVPLYAGDDTTDEDAFAALADGVTVLVAGAGRPTAARYRIGGVAALHAFLDNLADRHDGANRRC